MNCKLSMLLLLILFSINACKQEYEKKEVAVTAQKSKIAVREDPMVLNNLTETDRQLTQKDTADIHIMLRAGENMLRTLPDSSEKMYKTALLRSRQVRYDKGTVISLLCIGSYHMNFKKDYQTARRYYYSGLRYLERLEGEQSKKLMPDVYLVIANTYNEEANYDSAITNYYRALDLLPKSNAADTLKMAQIYTNLGAALVPLDEQWTRAYDYLFKAYQLAGGHKDTNLTVADIARNIGALYAKRKTYDSSLFFFQQALLLVRHLKVPLSIQGLYTDIGSLYLDKGEGNIARKYLDSAVQLDTRDALNQPYLLQTLGNLHQNQGKLKAAIQYYEQALQVYDRKNQGRAKGYLYAALAQLYDSLGQKGPAHDNLKKYAQLQDSLYQKDRLMSMNLAEVKYRTSEKTKELIEKQLLIAQQKNKIQRQYLWIGVGSISLMLVSGLLYRKRQKTKLEQFKASLEGEEKERLRMAAELHDGIVSRLSAVKMSFVSVRAAGIENTDFNEALQSLQQSITEIRSTSHNLQPFILQKMGLAAALENYSQTMSKATRLNVHFQLFGELPGLKEDFQLHIYRITQELVQNIVKHAQASRAIIQLTVRDSYLMLVVEDDGIGMPMYKAADAQGIGFHNLHNRIHLLHGTMSITSNKGTSIQMEFDLKPYLTH